MLKHVFSVLVISLFSIPLAAANSVRADVAVATGSTQSSVRIFGEPARQIFAALRAREADQDAVTSKKGRLISCASSQGEFSCAMTLSAEGDLTRAAPSFQLSKSDRPGIARVLSPSSSRSAPFWVSFSGPAAEALFGWLDAEELSPTHDLGGALLSKVGLRIRCDQLSLERQARRYACGILFDATGNALTARL